MEIEFNGNFDKNTLFRAVKLANKPSKWGSIYQIGMLLLIVFILVMAIISFIKDIENLSTSQMLRTGRHLLFVPVVLYFYLKPFFVCRQITEKIWKKTGDQAVLNGSFSSLGLAYGLSSVDRHEITWNEFAKKQVEEDMIVLVTANGILHFFPRHFFSSDHDWQVVTQWAKQKVVEAA